MSSSLLLSFLTAAIVIELLAYEIPLSMNGEMGISGDCILTWLLQRAETASFLLWSMNEMEWNPFSLDSLNSMQTENPFSLSVMQ